MPDDPGELRRLVEKREEELKRTKLRMAAKNQEVAAKAAEVREKAAEVRERDARLVTAEIRLTISNTELLRFQRTCVRACICVDGFDPPTFSRLASPFPPVHVPIPTLYSQTS